MMLGLIAQLLKYNGLTSCVLVLIMGFVGYIVKLIHIPVNNILVGGA